MIIGLVIFYIVWALIFPNLAAWDLNRRAKRMRICEDPEHESKSLEEEVDRGIAQIQLGILRAQAEVHQQLIEAQVKQREKLFIDVALSKRFL